MTAVDLSSPRPRTGETLPEYSARQARIAAAVAKAAATPGELSIEDVQHLPARTVRDLTEAGAMPQLGLGTPRKRR